MDEYDDDGFFEGLYEDGHWEWNKFTNSLEFKREGSSDNDITLYTPTAVSPIGFRDDLDILEQQKLRKLFQKNILADDVVTLQDVKNVVLFTAPKFLLTASIVSVLHLPMTERFIRALITYCQYFLQISDLMNKRKLELQSKLRTHRSDEIELEFRENLEDLRLLVAKEYCSIILGHSDHAKCHHMGTLKKLRSLSKKERILFESLLRISTQIVWVTLGQLEIHRIFKSEIYNIIERKLNVKYRECLGPRELFVLFGHCLQQGRMMTSFSPLMSEMRCVRDIDYRLLELGVAEHKSLNPRLRFFERVLITPEKYIKRSGISIGILGMPRSRFDTMLKIIEIPPSASSTSTLSVKRSQSKTATSRKVSVCASRTSSAKSMHAAGLPLYEDLLIPEKEDLS